MIFQTEMDPTHPLTPSALPWIDTKLLRFGQALPDDLNKWKPSSILITNVACVSELITVGEQRWLNLLDSLLWRLVSPGVDLGLVS